MKKRANDEHKQMKEIRKLERNANNKERKSKENAKRKQRFAVVVMNPNWVRVLLYRCASLYLSSSNTPMNSVGNFELKVRRLSMPDMSPRRYSPRRTTKMMTAKVFIRKRGGHYNRLRGCASWSKFGN